MQTTFSKPEAMAAELIESRSGARAQRTTDATANILNQLAELPDPRADRNLAQLPEHVTNLIMKVFHDHAPVIKPTVAAERDAKSEYEAWRDANGLTHRQPVYPTSCILHFALVLVALLTEAVINAFLYLNATPDGYLRALITAVLIAGINIGLAVFAGLVPLRYLNLPDRPVRYWAYPALFIASIAIASLNLYAAHYRDLAAASVDDFDEARVLARLLSEPFNLSLTSFALFFGGLLFAVFAAFKGYTSSDPYPKYEQQHRHYVDTADDLNYLKSAIHGALDTVREQEIVYAADKPLATRALIEAIRKSHATLGIQLDRARALDKSDAKAAAAAIDRFRQLNSAIRTDGVRPAYFDTRPDFALDAIQLDTADTIAPKVEAAAETHHAHTEKFLTLITNLLKQVESAKDRTETMMHAIEKSVVDEMALPDLSHLRDLIATQHPVHDRETVS